MARDACTHVSASAFLSLLLKGKLCPAHRHTPMGRDSDATRSDAGLRRCCHLPLKRRRVFISSGKIPKYNPLRYGERVEVVLRPHPVQRFITEPHLRPPSVPPLRSPELSMLLNPGRAERLEADGIRSSGGFTGLVRHVVELSAVGELPLTLDAGTIGQEQADEPVGCAIEYALPAVQVGCEWCRVAAFERGGVTDFLPDVVRSVLLPR